MENRTIDVAILPDRETIRKSRELGMALEQNYATDFSVLDSRYLPHITLRQMRIPDENYRKLKSKLQEIAERTRTFKLSLSSYEMFAGTWLSWKCDSSDALVNLHVKIMKETDEFRNGLKLLSYSQDGTGFFSGQKFPQERTTNVLKYGWGGCMDLYEPHLTIGKSKAPIKKQQIDYILPQYNSTFDVNKIIIGRMENTPRGTQIGYVLEVLEEISL